LSPPVGLCANRGVAVARLDDRVPGLLRLPLSGSIRWGGCCDSPGFFGISRGEVVDLSVRPDLITLWSFLAFAVERFVEIIVSIIPDLHKKRLLGVEMPLLLALVLSLTIAIGTSLDFFQVFSIEFRWPLVGYVLTALVMTGGSNLIHDLVSWVRAGKEAGQARVKELARED